MLKSEEATAEDVAKLGLRHRVHFPDSAAADKPPIVFLVHGRAGDASLMWTFAKVVQHLNAIVVAPEAFLPDPIGGWSWWQVETLPDGTPRKERRTTAADLSVAHQRLEPFIDGAIHRYGGDPARVYVMGFSQGAAVSAALSLRRPSLFRQVALLAGFIPSVVFNEKLIAPEVLDGSAKLPEYFFGHGTKDEVIALSMAEGVAAKLQSLGAEVKFVTDAVGHKVGIESLRELRTWFGRK